MKGKWIWKHLENNIFFSTKWMQQQILISQVTDKILAQLRDLFFP